jgi:hypothetical protein
LLADINTGVSTTQAGVIVTMSLHSFLYFAEHQRSDSQSR